MRLRRVLGLTSRRRTWVVAGVLLGAIAIGSNIALMGMSAYLISRAAVVDSVADVALAITTVRVLAIARAAFRYLERYVTQFPQRLAQSPTLAPYRLSPASAATASTSAH